MDKEYPIVSDDTEDLVCEAKPAWAGHAIGLGSYLNSQGVWS